MWDWWVPVGLTIAGVELVAAVVVWTHALMLPPADDADPAPPSPRSTRLMTLAEPTRCWWCGVEPHDVVEISSFGGEVTRAIGRWPAGDHEHEASPPTPEQLVERGHASLRRITDIWLEES